MAGLFLTSRLLSAAGVVHGFSLREGGASRGPYASLNLSHAVGDEAAAVQANLERLADAAGLALRGAAFATASQVHGDRVLAAQASPAGHVLRELFGESEPSATVSAAGQLPGERADAVVGLEPGVAVGVRVADCVPLLIADPDSGAAAAVHSGWRGARLAIAARSVRALAWSAGSDPTRLLAAVGPCIGRCCYEVSAELAAAFRRLFGEEVADDPARPGPHLDLRLCVERALVAAGVRRERIEQVEGCTSCDARRFFSHRRDAGRTGRHLAFAVASAGKAGRAG
jgi:YfiH family protein